MFINGKSYKENTPEVFVACELTPEQVVATFNREWGLTIEVLINGVKVEDPILRLANLFRRMEGAAMERKVIEPLEEMERNIRGLADKVAELRSTVEPKVERIMHAIWNSPS